jgi:type III pantothenate kinase
MDVPEPASVGADRIANAVAAAGRSRLPCIVVDLGTATHFEVVTDGPTFAGGIIAPGALTAADALFTGTARLAAVEFERPAHVLGRTTRECVQSGVFHGAIAQIEGLITALRRELVSSLSAAGGTGKPGVLATGGLAPLLAPESRLLRRVIPELTLEGIALLAARADRR